MSSNNLDLDGIKKIIRSLLISAKDGLNSIQLAHDFISQIGTPIAYESYGHLSLESFLYSIPDVVLVTKRGKMLHLRGVATNETSHIVRMVQMQTGGTSGMVAGPNTSRHKHKLFSSNTIQRSKHLPSVPEYVCVQVREVLLAYPNGIMLTYFPNAYQKRFGHYLQLMKFGTSSIHEFIGQIYGVGIITRKGTEYVELSTDARRKNLSPADKSPPGFSRHDSKPSFSEVTKQNLAKPATAVPERDPCTTTDKPADLKLKACVAEPQPLPENPLPGDKEREKCEKAITKVTLEPSYPTVKSSTWLEQLDKPNPVFPVQESKPEIIESPPSTPGTSVSKFIPPPMPGRPINQAARLAIYKHKHGLDMSIRLSAEISTLLAALPPRVPLDELMQAYKTQFGFDIPFRELCFSSCQDLIQSLWQTCRLDARENGIFVSLVAPRADSPTLVPIEELAPKPHSIAPEICERVRNLLLKWPSGMPISLLKEKFQDAYREHLPYLELGFDDVYEMMISMPDYVLLIPRRVIEPSKSDYILQGIPACTEECVDQVLPPPEAFFPSKRDVIISYTKQPIPANWEFKVFIPFISNPDRFWLHIVGPMTSGALEDNLEEITNFFDKMNQENKMEYLLNNPVEGQNCAAPYQKDGYYYRAKILKIPFPDQAEVHYVDYGNKSRVPLGSLRQLKNGHMVLPAQAIPCRLANVRPVDGIRWASGSAHKMKDLTNNIELFCKVQNIEPDDTLSVHLYLSQSETGMSINQTLITCGIAAYEENNTPLNPTRACMTPEESRLLLPFSNSQPQLQNAPYPFPPQSLPYAQPPPQPLPLPYPHGIPYYPMQYSYPVQSQFPFPFPTPHSYVPPYPQPPQPALQAYIPPPVQAAPPAPARPRANFQLGSRLLAPPPPAKPTPLPPQDSYVYNDRDNQILGQLLKEKETKLTPVQEHTSPSIMGTFEKVQKFLLTSTGPDELETQRKADCLCLDQLKSQQQAVYSKGVNIKDKTAFDHYLTQLQNLASEIGELEIKVSDYPPSPCDQSVPSPQLRSPVLTPPPVTEAQPASSLLANLLSAGRGRVIQVGETSAVRPQFKYKGIGRGGKMSDLV